jgi:hypothetical protein
MVTAGASASILPAKLYPFSPAINPALFSLLWVVLCAAGLVFMALFFMYGYGSSVSAYSLASSDRTFVLPSDCCVVLLPDCARLVCCLFVTMSDRAWGAHSSHSFRCDDR